ncbi:hypothetical protein P5V15_001187 [Pogonomyrmex californicus]
MSKIYAISPPPSNDLHDKKGTPLLHHSNNTQCIPPKEAVHRTMVKNKRRNVTRKFQLHFFYFFLFFSNIVQYYIFNFHSISVECRSVRLLSRRYTLTATGYKFLEIGINVGPPSYVEIALGDHREQELILSLETWKGLYEQRWNIYKLLRNDYKDNFISVGPLTVRVYQMNDVTLVRLESLNVRVTMIESTLRRMFDLDEYIDVMFDRYIVRFVDTIDTKYTRFSNIASVVTNPEEVPNAIRDCDIFDRCQLVDYELLALVFSV